MNVANNSFSVLFYIKKTKIQCKLTEKELEKQQIPIYCRITVNGLDSEISCKYAIEKSRWNKNRVTGTKEDAKLINNKLNDMELKIKKIFNTLEDKESQITAAIIRDIFLGKISKNRPKLIGLFEAFVKDREALFDAGKLAKGTLTKDKLCLSNIKLFIKDKYHKEDLLIDDMLSAGKEEFSFSYDFIQWAKTKTIEDVKKLWSHNYAAQVLSCACGAINMAYLQGKVLNNPLFKKSPSRSRSVFKYISSEDVLAIEKEQGMGNELEKLARDLFLFSCYTGFGYAELMAIKPENLALAMDNISSTNDSFTKYWLFIYRIKTKTTAPRMCKIPVLKKAYDIIEKYKNHPACENNGTLVPFIGSQVYNRYLKTLQARCKINQKLTAHVARHTCARIFLDSGFSKEFVAAMFGHSDTNLIGKIYGEISTQRMSLEMEERGKQAISAFV